MRKGRDILWNLVIGLSVIGLGGCAAVYCARAYGENPWNFALRQVLWLGVGILLFLLTALSPFRRLRKAAVPCVVLFFFILLLTALYGVPVNGMSGWVPIPFLGIRIQPSELAKAPFLLTLCIVAVQQNMSEWKRFFLLLGLTCLFVFAILLQPDFGTATVYAAIFPILLFSAGFRKRIVAAVCFGWIPFVFLFLTRHPYALKRISAYLNPDADLYGAGWHIHQFRFTMANGGWTGSGEQGPLWANTYLPYSHSDSVFSTLVEASGMVGGTLVILGFCVMLLLFRKASLETTRADAGLFLFCTGCVLTMQAFLHIGVNVTLLPPTGLPLPFFSYGGSNLAGVMMLLGAACSAYRCGESEAQIDPETVQKHDQNNDGTDEADQNRPESRQS